MSELLEYYREQELSEMLVGCWDSQGDGVEWMKNEVRLVVAEGVKHVLENVRPAVFQGEVEKAVISLAPSNLGERAFRGAGIPEYNDQLTKQEIFMGRRLDVVMGEVVGEMGRDEEYKLVGRADASVKGLVYFMHEVEMKRFVKERISREEVGGKVTYTISLNGENVDRAES